MVEAKSIMHATLEKFGYPGTLLKETEHWCILMRPAQVTLGALVLCSKHQAASLSSLPESAFAEMASATRHIEKSLTAFRPYDKINYLALMMADPHVHFHVLPRYASQQEFAGASFADPAWPGPPDLKIAANMTENVKSKLYAALMDVFARPV